MLTCWEIIGGLTKKQKQALENIHTIIIAFYDKNYKKCPRTWTELLNRTGLSKGALSKHLRELIRQGVVVTTLQKNRLTRFYEYTGKFLSIKGKILPEEIPGNVCRIWFNDKGIVKYEWGYMKKGKGGYRYFAKEQ